MNTNLLIKMAGNFTADVLKQLYDLTGSGKSLNIHPESIQRLLPELESSIVGVPVKDIPKEFTKSIEALRMYPQGFNASPEFQDTLYKALKKIGKLPQVPQDMIFATPVATPETVRDLLGKVTAKEKMVESLQNSLRGNEAALTNRNSMIESLQKSLRENEAALTNRNSMIESLQKSLDASRGNLADNAKILASNEEVIAKHLDSLAKSEGIINSLKDTASGYESTISSQAKELVEKGKAANNPLLSLRNYIMAPTKSEFKYLKNIPFLGEETGAALQSAAKKYGRRAGVIGGTALGVGGLLGLGALMNRQQEPTSIFW